MRARFVTAAPHREEITGWRQAELPTADTSPKSSQTSLGPPHQSTLRPVVRQQGLPMLAKSPLLHPPALCLVIEHKANGSMEEGKRRAGDRKGVGTEP